MKAPLRLDRADSGRIVLDGGRQPDRCTLVFSGSNGIEVHEGGGLTIQGLTVKAVNAADRECIGIVVGHGAKTRLERVNVSDFQAGVVAENGGRIEAEQCNVETAILRGVGVGFQSHLNGTMALVRCTATKSKRDDNWSAGFVASTGGYLGCEACEASGWDHGFLSHLNSCLWLTRRCASKGNDSGLTVTSGSSATADDREFTGDAEWAVKAANGGTMLIRGCTLSKSAYGCCATSNSTVMFASLPSRISGSTAAAFQSQGGGTFDGVKPTLTGNRREHAVMPATTPEDQVFFWE